MAKRRLKLRVRLPPYRTPRNAWRSDVYRVVVERQRHSKVSYRDTDRLEIQVRLYLGDLALRFHDLDNRLKDIMDALLGGLGGQTRNEPVQPIISNDSQIYRAIVEKGTPPGQSHGMGHLIIRKFVG